MPVFTLHSRQRIERPLDEVFAFFADARNLERLTPPWLRFRILSEGRVTMEPGAVIDYRIKVHGLPLRWRSRITAWEPPFRFVDEQVRGPYRMWVHEHRFDAHGDATIVSDGVRYRIPGGRLVHRLFVKPDLDRIFAYRRERLAAIFGTAPAAAEPQVPPAGWHGTG